MSATVSHSHHSLNIMSESKTDIAPNLGRAVICGKFSL